jgi:protocatechuate 4,5-dioxygenase beta chain
MAEIVGGVATSHIPAVGAAIDKGKKAEPYWAPYFAKLPPLQDFVRELRPDAAIVVYNDHANAFSFQVIPTFAIGTAPLFQIADEGFGRRPVPPVQGDPDLAWHLAETLILDGFDMTIVNEMEVDHGLTVPLSLIFAEPTEWPCPVVPLCVNVVQYPPPTGKRCFELGKAIRRAVDAYPGAERVLIVGTGGLSHQLQGERVGLINEEWDHHFLDLLVAKPDEAAAIPHVEYLREAGSEGIEMVMWLVMRGALDGEVREVYRATHVPTSNTHNGMLALENSGGGPFR